jgi:hypothetical protein
MLTVVHHFRASRNGLFLSVDRFNRRSVIVYFIAFTSPVQAVRAQCTVVTAVLTSDVLKIHLSSKFLFIHGY